MTSSRRSLNASPTWMVSLQKGYCWLFPSGFIDLLASGLLIGCSLRFRIALGEGGSKPHVVCFGILPGISLKLAMEIQNGLSCCSSNTPYCITLRSLSTIFGGFWVIRSPTASVRHSLRVRVRGGIFIAPAGSTLLDAIGFALLHSLLLFVSVISLFCPSNATSDRPSRVTPGVLDIIDLPYLSIEKMRGMKRTEIFDTMQSEIYALLSPTWVHSDIRAIRFILVLEAAVIRVVG